MSKPAEIVKLESLYGITIKEWSEAQAEKFRWDGRSRTAAFVKRNNGEIRRLFLLNCGVSDVSALASLTALTQLGLSNNQVSDVSALASLTALTELWLSKNQVSDVSALASLTALTELWLSNNQVSDVSALASLTALTQLGLDNNQVSDVFALASLTALTVLGLSNNQVSDVSALASLTALTQLGLDNNQVSDVFALASLTALTVLGLSNNQVSDVSALASLTALTYLDLSNNQVSDVSALLPLLKKELTTLSLSNNPLFRPPVEIAENGPEAIVAWFTSEQAGTTVLNEVKVLLVGAGGAGKTSLVGSLTGKDFNLHETQTPGIVVTKKTFSCTTGVSVTAHLWDFGGQEIMHATHQFFLSRRSLYLLVLNSRIDDGSEEYWLKLIASFGGNSPVLVVFSQNDQNPGFDLNRRNLLEKYPNIRGFYPLSNQSGEGLAALKNAITAILPNLELVQTTWPRSWLNVKQTLETLKKPYIDYDRFRALCAKKSVVVEEFQDRLLEYLHELGVALHYPDLEWLNTQVLKPEWVTEPVYALINHAEVAKAHGLLHYKNLPKLLPNFPKNKLTFLGQLMAKFEICHPVEPNQLLFPDLLPKSKPDLPFDEQEALRLEIKYHFLPRAILPRLMVRLYPDIQTHPSGRYQWRAGVLFKHPDLDSQALVQADHDQRQISIQTNGKHRRDYLATILRILRDIQATYHKIEAEEQVRCICSKCKTNPKPHRFPYESLLQFEHNGRATLPCFTSYEEVSIKQLLEGTYAANEVMLVAHREVASWCKRLKALFASGSTRDRLVIWDDDAIPVGAKEAEEYDAALARARGVVILVSPNYYADPFLRTFQRKIEKAKNRGLKVFWIPIGPVQESHQHGQYRALTPDPTPLSLLVKAKADKALAEAAGELNRLLGRGSGPGFEAKTAETP